MLKRTTKRLLTLAFALAMVIWCTHAISHWHAHSYTEQNCQLCHIGHSVMPQSTVTSAVQVPVPVARYIAPENAPPDLKPDRTLSTPRAPPVA